MIIILILIIIRYRDDETNEMLPNKTSNCDLEQENTKLSTKNKKFTNWPLQNNNNNNNSTIIIVNNNNNNKT